ncbi:flagellar rod assembly protein/muramidase FlgJ [Planctomycetes bacterium Poly30]|uniref:Flagellar rod assembly protein/muramidase FlgJ n=1 Tax=Saltatorellus ferox TaxID=2528018 RepID=A0A518F0V1_9BACT|nr:flagellar rod assembly protein/muramidase FlgJ [Planctomycetes bacterium Poly30]
MDGLTLGNAAAPQRNDLLANRISRMDKGSGKGEPEMVAQEIESLFATLLVSEMRKGLGEGFFGSGAGSDTFNGWFDEEIGASLSARGSLGLADAVHESLIREKAAADAEALRHVAEGKKAPEEGTAR